MQKKNSLLFMAFSFLISTNLYASYMLNVHLIQKRPIDGTLVLRSELHEKIEIFEGQLAKVKMKNGVAIDIKIDRVPNTTTNHLVEIYIDIFLPLKSKVQQFNQKFLSFLGDKFTLKATSSEGMVMEFIVHPLLKK